MTIAPQRPPVVGPVSNSFALIKKRILLDSSTLALRTLPDLHRLDLFNLVTYQVLQDKYSSEPEVVQQNHQMRTWENEQQFLHRSLQQ